MNTTPVLLAVFLHIVGAVASVPETDREANSTVSLPDVYVSAIDAVKTQCYEVAFEALTGPQTVDSEHKAAARLLASTIACASCASCADFVSQLMSDDVAEHFVTDDDWKWYFEQVTMCSKMLGSWEQRLWKVNEAGWADEVGKDKNHHTQLLVRAFGAVGAGDLNKSGNGIKDVLNIRESWAAYADDLLLDMTTEKLRELLSLITVHAGEKPAPDSEQAEIRIAWAPEPMLLASAKVLVRTTVVHLDLYSSLFFLTTFEERQFQYLRSSWEGTLRESRQLEDLLREANLAPKYTAEMDKLQNENEKARERVDLYASAAGVMQAIRKMSFPIPGIPGSFGNRTANTEVWEELTGLLPQLQSGALDFPEDILVHFALGMAYLNAHEVARLLYGPFSGGPTRQALREDYAEKGREAMTRCVNLLPPASPLRQAVKLFAGAR